MAIVADWMLVWEIERGNRVKERANGPSEMRLGHSCPSHDDFDRVFFRYLPFISIFPSSHHAFCLTHMFILVVLIQTDMKHVSIVEKVYNCK